MYGSEGSDLTFFIQILTSFYMKLRLALILRSLYKIKTFHKLSITAVSAEIWIYASVKWY